MSNPGPIPSLWRADINGDQIFFEFFYAAMNRDRVPNSGNFSAYSGMGAGYFALILGCAHADPEWIRRISGK